MGVLGDALAERIQLGFIDLHSARGERLFLHVAWLPHHQLFDEMDVVEGTDSSRPPLSTSSTVVPNVSASSPLMTSSSPKARSIVPI